jgi:hypothetical protein
VRLLAVLALCCGFACHAAKMPSYDLASLYWLADVVVETVNPEFKKLQWHEEGEVEVIVCYKGTVKPGDKLPVSIHTFSWTLPFQGALKARVESDGGVVHEPIDERKLKVKRTLMFLRWDKKTERYLICANGLVCEADGDGAIYGFQQNFNPGPYAPVPAQPRYTALPDDGVYSWKIVLKELAKAIEHANQFDAAWRKKEVKELLSYLNVPWQKLEGWSGQRYLFSLEVAKWISREHKDQLEAALAVTEQPQGCKSANNLLKFELKQD